MVASQLRERNEGSRIFRTIGEDATPRRYGQKCRSNGGLGHGTTPTIKTYGDAEATPLVDPEEVFVRTFTFSEAARSVLRVLLR